MPIHSPTAASGSVLGEFTVKVLEGWWVLLCRISTITEVCKELVCAAFSAVYSEPQTVPSAKHSRTLI